MMRKTEFYVVLERRRARSEPKKVTAERLTSSREPSTKPNQRVIKVAVEVPDAFFDEPALTANIRIDESSVPPPSITADTIASLTGAVYDATGIVLDVREPDSNGDEDG